MRRTVTISKLAVVDGKVIPDKVIFSYRGVFLKPPVVGETAVFLREKDQKDKYAKTLTTSEVVEITDFGFKTLNSIYKIEKN